MSASSIDQLSFSILLARENKTQFSSRRSREGERTDDIDERPRRPLRLRTEDVKLEVEDIHEETREEKN